MMDRICIPVQDELSLVEEILLKEMVSGMDTIDQIARYVVRNGGKRIRPALFLLATRVTGAKAPGLARLAAALEMLHTASLLHDDVVDDAAMRRGKPSANAKWGNQVSVLIGDLLLARASKVLVEEGDASLMAAATDAIAKTTEGELLEIVNQNNIDVDPQTYLKIIQGKTAALFALAGKAAAIVAKIAKPYEEAMNLFGQNLGLAFQLADDTLDYVADEKKFGKHAGTDLKEGKLTYPLIVALARATPDEYSIIQNALIAGRPSPEQFTAVRTIIDRRGGIDATWQLAREFSSKAKEALAVFKPSIERDSLMMLADYAVERGE